MSKAVTIIGIGDDGCVGLSSRAVNAVSKCQVLVGGERQLEFFPQHEGHKILLKGGLMKAVAEITELADENNICVLASGDPMFYGIGSLIMKKVGTENCEVIPQPSSISLAFAKAGIKWNDAYLTSFHGRPLEGFLTRLKHFNKLGILTDEKNSPQVMAQSILDSKLEGWQAWVCENLCGKEERVRHFKTMEELAKCSDISKLNVVIFINESKEWQASPALPNLHEDEFTKRVPKKGLITKKEVRTLSLAEMNLKKGSVIWDVGAASGSVAISAAITAYEGKAYAIETDERCYEFLYENLKTLAVDNVTVIEGRAPDALEDLEDPDAIFVGGSKGSLKAIIELSLKRLKENGRLVVNAITFENIQEAYQTFKDLEIEVNIIQLNVSRCVPLARFHRYEPLNPIHIFSCTKPKEI